MRKGTHRLLAFLLCGTMVFSGLSSAAVYAEDEQNQVDTVDIQEAGPEEALAGETAMLPSEEPGAVSEEKEPEVTAGSEKELEPSAGDAEESGTDTVVESAEGAAAGKEQSLNAVAEISDSTEIRSITYREKGTNIYKYGTTEILNDREHSMYCTVPEEVIGHFNEYNFLVTAPNGEPKVQEHVEQAGTTGNYAIWTYNPTAPGKYIVSIKKKVGDTEVAKGEIEIVEVTFHTGEGGSFSDEKTTHIGYYSKPGYKYAVYLDRFGLVPKVTPTQDSFIGWSWKESPSGSEDALPYADLYTLIEKKPEVNDGRYNVYAVYGTEKIYNIKLIDGEQEIQTNSEIQLSQAEGDYDPETCKKVLTIQNTGNQPINIEPRNRPGFLDVDFNKPDEEGSGIQVITIPAEKSGTIVLKPKKGLSPGDYNETFSFMVSEKRAYYSFTIKFTVLSRTLVVKPEAKTKKYGATLTAEDISTEIVYENTETKYSGDLNSLGVTLNSTGFKKDAVVGSYPYTVNTSVNPAFTVKLADNASMTVEQDTPVYSSLEASSVHVGSTLSASALKGTFVNSNDPSMNVPGTLEWVNKDQSVGSSEGSFPAEWKFTPYDTTNYKETSGQVNVTVSTKTATNLERDAESAQTVVYDGKPHSLAYRSDRSGDDTEIKVKYRLNGTDNWTEDAPVDAGVYEVNVSIAESQDYAPATKMDTLTIEQKTLSFTFEIGARRYNGTKNVTVNHVIVHGSVDSGIGAEYHAEFESPDVNTQAKAIITVTGLTGDKAYNYKLAENPVYHAAASIFPQSLTITPKEFTKGYGTLLYLTTDDFEITGLMNKEDAASIEFISQGELADADVNAQGYGITAHLTNTNYTFDPNFKSLLTVECGTVKVTQAEPKVNGSLSVGMGRKGCELDHVTLAGGFINPNNSDIPVAGMLKWKDEGVILPADSDSYEAAWVFTPNDTKNYKPVEGTVTILLQDKEPIHITVTGDTEVAYDGQPHGLTAELDPKEAIYDVEYRPYQSTDNWTAEEPVNAGTYEVCITAYEYGEYAGNQVIAQLSITAVAPDSTAPTELTVPQGTALNSETVRGEFADCFTFGGETVDGTFSWVVPEGVVTDDDLEFVWVFVPASSNYTTIGGSTTFKLADDERTISADIYNLPASLNYKDYAVVDIAGSNLKAGDEVTFFKDKDHRDPVSDSVLITAEDVGNGFLIVWLDGDALEPGEDGSLYARITNSKKNPVTELSYEAEPGFALEDNGGGPDETILVHPDLVTMVYAKLFNEYYKVSSVTSSLDESDIVRMEPGTDKYSWKLIGNKLGGDVVLAVTVVFDHPDPAHSGETISFTVSKIVSCSGSLDAAAESGQGAPEVTVDEQGMRDSVMSEWDRKDLVEGKKINYLLHVENEDDTNVPSADIAMIDETLKMEHEDFTVGQYLDITLTRSVNDESESQIHETSKPLTITIRILPELMEAAKEATNWPQFVVVRMHEGKATILEDQDTDPDTITIETGLFSTYAIAYRNPLGDLTVTNKVTGSGDKSKAFNFTVTLEDKSISGKRGGMDFTDGVARFTLKHGESLTAEDLPAGMSYTVVEAEANKDGYTTTSEGASGTVKDSETTWAVFTNHRDKVVAGGDADKPGASDKNGNKASSKASPQTGDNSHIVLWSVLMIASLLCAVVTVMFSVRRRSRVRAIRRRRRR